MNNQNWQLNEGDQFAPPVADTLEHLPSFHCEKAAIQSTTLKPCDCSYEKPRVCDYCAGHGKDKSQ